MSNKPVRRQKNVVENKVTIEKRGEGLGNKDKKKENEGLKGILSTIKNILGSDDKDE